MAKEIMATNCNFFLVPEGFDKGPLRTMVELILITSEPRYIADEAGMLVKSRVTETHRVQASAKAVRELGEKLLLIADAADELLGKVSIEKTETGGGE